jgi:hypothetical protein
VAPEFDARHGALRSSLYNPQTHTSIVDEKLTARLQDRKHFPMGQTQVRGVAEPRLKGEPHRSACFEHDPTTRHGAQAELRPLQIGQNANGPPQGALDVTDRLHIAGKGSVIGMTHIDAENVDTRFTQATDQV